MTESIKQELQALMAEKRWQAALNLLNSQPNSEELIGLRAKVEAHLGLITPAAAYIIEYIEQHRNRYSQESILRKLLDAGYSNDTIQEAFEQFGLKKVAVKAPSRQNILKLILLGACLAGLVYIVMGFLVFIAVLGACNAAF